MRFYESVFIARQDISTGQVNTLCDEFEKIITDGGGKILKKEYWGLKGLQYRIKKNRKGHYVMFNMEADPATMAEYGRRLGLNEDVLRVLTIKIKAVDKEPSVMMQAKSDRPTEGTERAETRKAGAASQAGADTEKTTKPKTPAKAESPKEETEEGAKAKTAVKKKAAKKTATKKKAAKKAAAPDESADAAEEQAADSAAAPEEQTADAPAEQAADSAEKQAADAPDAAEEQAADSADAPDTPDAPEENTSKKEGE